MINCLEGRPNVSLSECQVTAINNPSAPTANPIRRSPLSVDRRAPECEIVALSTCESPASAVHYIAHAVQVRLT